MNKPIGNKKVHIRSYFLDVGKESFHTCARSLQSIKGYRFYSKNRAGITFSEDVALFGVEKYFNYLFYLNNSPENVVSSVMQNISRGSVEIELHQGARKDVVEDLLSKGYNVSEHIPMAYASDAYPDFHFRFFIATRGDETKYAISSVAEKR